jgi:valyl-tRNA synthetase
MSKSKYNVVNPDDIAEEYGADCLRLYEMFLGPLEQSKPWNTQGLSGVYGFLKKFYNLYFDGDNFSVSEEGPTKAEQKVLHTLIKKFTFDIQNFSFNTLLSHGFFMKDGLMGEFAKEKIQSIINYHEELLKKELTKNENKKQRDKEKAIYEKEHKSEFWKIQSIIGDDYLKQVIKNHLIEIEKIVLGNDEAKEEEIKRLKAQIELLEK